MAFEPMRAPAAHASSAARVGQGEERTQMTITTATDLDGAARAVPVQRTDSAGRTATVAATRPEMSAEDLDAQSPAADLVRVYLNGIGKTALLTAAQEVDLARRIEAGVFAQHVLDTAAEEGRELSRQYWRPTCGWWCRWPSATPAAACRCSTSSRKATSA
jgi:RNA polymerase nonessential primary-like sigma factor